MSTLTHNIWMIVIVLILVPVTAQMVSAETAQTWYFTDEDIGTASIVDHVVISEVCVKGTNSNDEFVELYNPTDSEISLEGWKLQYKPHNKLTWTSKVWAGLPTGSEIEPHKFFLLASKYYDGDTMPDYRHGSNWGLQDNDGHVRIVDAGESEIDKVGYGVHANSPEGDPAPKPPVGGSIERKAGSDSESGDMASGGYHYSWGNGQDEGNNSVDFITKTTPEPQNSQSPIEVYPTKASDSATTHEIDGVMSKTAPEDATISKTVSDGTGRTVLWWYSEYPAECDVGFGENSWTAHVCYDNTDGTDGTLSAEVFKVASADGTTTRLAYGSDAISTGASGSIDITCDDDAATTQIVPKGDRFAARISWDQSTAIAIKFNSSEYNSYLTSPASDPSYPVPEPATIILFSAGLLILAGYVYVGRRNK